MQFTEVDGLVHIEETAKGDFIDVGRVMLAAEFSGNICSMGPCVYVWDSGRYVEETADSLLSRISSFIDTCRRVTYKTVGGAETRSLERYKKTTLAIKEVYKALVAWAPSVGTKEIWIGDKKSEGRMISFRNGLLDSQTGEFIDHDPEYFTTLQLDYDYQPDARCPLWLDYIADRWPEDQEALDALQQMFGYILFGNGEIQKIFYIWGESRSGKGTIAKVLEAVLGSNLVAPFYLSDLSERFGKHKAIDKRLLLFADVRVGKANHESIAESLLTMSGGDIQSVPRRYKDDYLGPLNSVMLMLSNEVLQIRENSTALSNRMVMWRTVGSFLGKERPGILFELFAEKAGILNWAWEGWETLREANYKMLEPKSGLGSKDEFEASSTPIKSFVEESCVFGGDHEVDDKDVYEGYVLWSRASGLGTVSRSAFRARISAACPGVRVKRLKLADGTRKYVLAGIQLAKNVFN